MMALVLMRLTVHRCCFVAALMAGRALLLLL